MKATPLLLALVLPCWGIPPEPAQPAPVPSKPTPSAPGKRPRPTRTKRTTPAPTPTKSLLPRPIVGTTGKAFKGPEGLLVWTLRIGEEENQEVLIQYGGVDHPWCGRIFKASIRERQFGQDYVIWHEGRPYVTFLMRRPANSSDSPFCEAHLPGRAPMRVAYDEAASQHINPQDLLSLYLQQEGLE